jgi:hypothetical protein
MQNPVQPIGPLSLVLGSVALVSVATATHIQSVIRWGSWEVVKFASRFGLLAAPESAGDPAFRPPSLFTLNDYTVTLMLLWFGLYLAFAGILVAICSEALREQNLYVASGIALSSHALILFNPSLGITALVVSTFAAMFVRRNRPARARTSSQDGSETRIQQPLYGAPPQ